MIFSPGLLMDTILFCYISAVGLHFLTAYCFRAYAKKINLLLASRALAVTTLQMI